MLLAGLLFLAPTRGWAENSGPEPAPQPQNETGSPSEEISEAAKLMREKKWPEAVVVIRSALEENPGSSGLELDLTRALTYSGRREEAINVLQQMIARASRTARPALVQRARVLSRTFLTNTTFQTYQDGVNLMLAGKYRAAQERFEKALGQEPSNIEALTRLGQCLVMQRDYDSAAERLRLARRLNPYEPEIHLWLGRALDQRGEGREALAELGSAYHSMAGSETAAIWYAEALYGSGQRTAGIEKLEQDVRHYPAHVLSLIELSRDLMSVSSTYDSAAAWQARKELQLAVSRMPIYLGETPSGESADDPASRIGEAKAIDPMGDLSVDLRQTESQLRHRIDPLMTQAEGRIEGSTNGK